MIRTLSELRRYIAWDAAARGVETSLGNVLRDPVFRFTCLLRLNEYLVGADMPGFLRWVPRLLFKRLSIRLGFSIPLNVFGPGLVIVHYGLVIVSPFARIGSNCRIHAGVNIGGAAGFVSLDEARELAPVIGDRCYIGPGAKIFGRSRIGDDCAIGANAVVNNLQTDGICTIAGVPARVVSHKGSFGMIHPNAM